MFEISQVSNVKEYDEVMAKELTEAISKVLTEQGINKKEAKGDGEFEVVATTAGVDRDGEIIKIEGWELGNFMKNPVLLFGHNYWSLPIGAVTSLTPDGDKLIAKGIFAKTAAAQEIRQLYDDGILKAVSVGFIVRERDPNNHFVITKAELLELSFVPVPANADALSLSKFAKAVNFFEQKTLKDIVEVESNIVGLRKLLNDNLDTFVKSLHEQKTVSDATPTEAEDLLNNITKGLYDFFASVKTATKSVVDENRLSVREDNSKKEGRVLSAKNRSAIENAIKVLGEILDLAEEKTAPVDALKGLQALLKGIDRNVEQALISAKKALE